MAITRIIALFNLKPGVKMADYEAWARAKDLPTVNGLPSIKSFQVFKTKEVMGGGQSRAAGTASNWLSPISRPRSTGCARAA